jgi:hypothetical protein
MLLCMCIGQHSHTALLWAMWKRVGKWIHLEVTSDCLSEPVLWKDACMSLCKPWWVIGNIRHHTYCHLRAQSLYICKNDKVENPILLHLLWTLLLLQIQAIVENQSSNSSIIILKHNKNFCLPLATLDFPLKYTQIQRAHYIICY